MDGSLRVAGLLLATAVATTALPAALPGVAVAAAVPTAHVSTPASTPAPGHAAGHTPGHASTHATGQAVGHAAAHTTAHTTGHATGHDAGHAGGNAVGQAGSDRPLARLLARFTRLDPLQRLGILKKMNAKYPGIGAVLDKLQSISVTGLLGQSIPESPENKSVTTLLNDPGYKDTADDFRAQPNHEAALSVLKESMD
ncbi:hypothetical protein [Actinomadura rudentiformis]|uniref:DUF4476 domain-containing protein n=1 Tax=Actinomadura rudentiformis TaxID=359158 RepID=A0A6H9Z5V6_9ACTN|nr:hypothetical protein [Actinomadura rudentiformis]KAB2350352.1 hypothetical protein F8566_11300 [Actinomadura rudentiformis]